MGDKSPVLLLVLLTMVSRGLCTNITQDILQALGLSRVPDMSKANVSQEEWARMTQVYLDRVAARHSAEAGTEPEEHSLQRLFTFQSASVGAGRSRRSVVSSRSPRSRIRMELPLDAQVDQAELRVLVTEPGSLRLFELWSGGRQRLAEVERPSAGWTQLDVTAAARRAAGEARPLLLELRCRHCDQPALNVLAVPRQDGEASRSKRAAPAAASVGRSECGKDGHRCCRHSLEVEFAQLPGLEFILQPKTFDAGFCRGRCPPRFHPAHHHALIQGLIRRRDNRQQDGVRRVPRPCCAPANLKPLDILFLDEENPTKLKVQAWSDMRVVDCACA